MRVGSPGGNPLSVGIKAKLRLPLGVHTSVSPFVTWEAIGLDYFPGGPAAAECGEGVGSGASAQTRLPGLPAAALLALPGGWEGGSSPHFLFVR